MAPKPEKYEFLDFEEYLLVLRVPLISDEDDEHAFDALRAKLATEIGEAVLESLGHDRNPLLKKLGKGKSAGYCEVRDVRELFDDRPELIFWNGKLCHDLAELGSAEFSDAQVRVVAEIERRERDGVSSGDNEQER